MSAPLQCAASGCNNPVVRRPGQNGRPPIYCSPTCRPSHSRSALVVEVDRDTTHDDHPPGRDWVVHLRRGQRVVVLRHGLGRFAATAFAAELRPLLPVIVKETSP